MEPTIYVAVKGLLKENGRTLMVRRIDRKADDPIGWWEFPGGTMEFGETAEATLVREYREETGLTVKPRRLLFASTVFCNPAYQIVVITYECTRVDGGEVRLSSEHSDYQWADAAMLRKYLAEDIRESLDRSALWEWLEQ